MPLPIYLFHGENDFLSSEKIRFWRDKFIEKHGGDINITIFEADKKTKANEIISNFESMPFLGEKRLIIVKNFFKNSPAEEQKKLSENLEKIPDFSVLVFIEQEAVDKRLVLYKKITKIGQTEEFPNLEGINLYQWIEKSFQKMETKISFSEIKYLGDYSGNNLWHLTNEMSKLSLYRKNEQITKEDINLLTKANLSLSVFKLVDYIGQKNTISALGSFNDLINKGEEVGYLFHMIIRQFRILLLISDLQQKKVNEKEMIPLLQMKPFIIFSASKQAKNYTYETLKTLYKKLLDIEIALKTGKIKQTTNDQKEFVIALEKFIVESCKN